MSNKYPLGASPEEQDRLQRQDRALGGIEPLLPYIFSGQQILEIGCGPGLLTEQIAKKIEPGKVIGSDIQFQHVKAAQSRTQMAQIESANFIVADGSYLPFQKHQFDLVYCRLLLVWVTEPLRVVKEMARVVRPGGAVYADEIDWGIRLTYPPANAIERVNDATAKLWEMSGGHPYLGRQLANIFRSAGLEKIKLECKPRLSYGNTLRTDGIWNVGRWNKLLAQGLIDTETYTNAQRDEQSLLENPDSFTLSLNFSAVGYIPQ